VNRFLFLGLLALAATAFGSSNFPLQVVAPKTLHAGKEIVPIQVRGPDNAHAEAKVFDQQGREIALLQRLSDDTYGWNGRDGSGRLVTPGTYLIEITEEPYLWNGAVTVLQ
jgi:hypothetical protein